MRAKVSVIVPTHNRRVLLGHLLESLFQQTLPAAQFEIIVVSDGSTDSTAELIKSLQTMHTNLVFAEQRNQGPAAARNRACQMAKGQYLAFTDDDCIAPPDWLENLLKVFQKTGAVAVQGRTSTIEEACTPLTNQVWNEQGMFGVPTCNAGYRKDVFDRVGGFDEAFTFPHNEDADLAWRVEKLGPIVFAREVRIIHPPRLETLWRRAYWVRNLETDFLLCAKHPEIYRQRCGVSPWSTIYWHAFVLSQLLTLKSSVKYLVRSFRPAYFFQSIGLFVVRGANLIRFFPFYYRAARRYNGRSEVTEQSRMGQSLPPVSLE